MGFSGREVRTAGHCSIFARYHIFRSHFEFDACTALNSLDLVESCNIYEPLGLQDVAQEVRGSVYCQDLLSRDRQSSLGNAELRFCVQRLVCKPTTLFPRCVSRRWSVHY